jgi:hypothetical protein
VRQEDVPDRLLLVERQRRREGARVDRDAVVEQIARRIATRRAPSAAAQDPDAHSITS